MLTKRLRMLSKIENTTKPYIFKPMRKQSRVLEIPTYKTKNERELIKLIKKSHNLLEYVKEMHPEVANKAIEELEITKAIEEKKKKEAFMLNQRKEELYQKVLDENKIYTIKDISCSYKVPFSTATNLCRRNGLGTINTKQKPHTRYIKGSDFNAYRKKRIEMGKWKYD